MKAMKSNKGISMITLIITVIVMIIFLGIAYRIGSRYIFESKEEERASLVSILSTSVERRQNDKYVGASENIYYTGYRIAEEDFEKLFEKFTDKNCMYAPGLWYAVDATKAGELGIVDSEKYLINDLKNEYDEDDEKYLAVVDYYTGKVELLKKEDIGDIIGNITDKDDGTGCEHQWTVVSCIEPSVCNKCGTISIGPLGHEYLDINGNPTKEPVATCTEDAVCTRCGYIALKAIGHDYDTSTLSYNDEGHFNKCIRYEQCFGVGNFEKHNRDYLEEYNGDGKWLRYHDIICTDNCGWTKEDEQCTIAIRPKDTYHHIVYCTLCAGTEEVEHDKLAYKNIDKNEHMVYCDSCKSDLYREEHLDIEIPYGKCDKCTGEMDITNTPRVDVVTMENITPSGESIYWAKKGDKIKITLQVSVLLAENPTIKLQDIELKTEGITRQDLTYTIEVDTNEYAFVEGHMGIEVSNIKSIWSVEGENVYETTDGNYITYDSIKPVYIHVPES